MPSGYTFDSSHGPGVGSGSAGSGSGGSNFSGVRSSVNSLARSVSNAVKTNGSSLGNSIREVLENPRTSAKGAMSYDGYINDYGLGFDMDDYLDQLEGIAKRNNEWSAEQADKMMQFQRQSDQAAMAWSAAEAQKGRDWTEKLSDNAHQREVRDLIAAGLNPILSANNGAWAGSGSVGQGFSSSGAMGETDMTTSGAFANAVSGMMTSARDIAITKLQTQAQRYSADRAFAASKMATEGSILNNNNTVSAQKAINALNRDADIKKASISADATKAAAGATAGAMMSAAATNAAAARYSADQHLEASKYGSDQSLTGTKYSSDNSLAGTKYSTDNDYKRNPVGYVETQINKLSNAWSDIDNVYSPGLDVNMLGSE